MINLTFNFNWYDITKDLIIPLLGVVSTIVIGVIIALTFKKRDEKIKTKGLLIDTYMEYLNTRAKNLNYEILVRKYEILEDIELNYGRYFEEHANTHFARKLISAAVEIQSKQIDGFDKNMIWHFYTHKFRFFLGGKIYDKELHELETRIVREYYSPESTARITEETKKEIIADTEIAEKVNSLDLKRINNGISMIESYIYNKYTEIQFQLFSPYEQKLSDLINSY